MVTCSMFITRAELERRQSIKKVKLSLDDETPEDLSRHDPHFKGGHHHGAGADLNPRQRTLIGIVAQFDTSANVGKQFGISGEHIRTSLRQGKHNRSDKDEEPDPAFKEAEERLNETIVDKAMALTEEALDGVDINDIDKPLQKIAAAEKLTKIVRTMRPNEARGPGNQTVIFNSVPTRGEDAYEVIDV